MSKMTMSRRSFLIASATTAAALSIAKAPSAFAATDEESSATEENVKRIRSCCRGCGKMECGVWVTVKDGRVVKIEGDESAFQSRGNCCSKSQSSVQAAYHPDRLQYPMKRTNPKGEDAGWQRISWDEALEICAKSFQDNIEKYGDNASFYMQGTSRPTAMTAATMGLAINSPNNYTAFEICKGPRYVASNLMDSMDYFWMGTSLQTRVYVQWGTECAYSNYDDASRVCIDNAIRSQKHILVDPRMTPLGKEADWWIDLRPGSDLAIAMCWFHLIEQNDLYDNLFVKRWTNAPFLVCADMEASGGLLFEELGGMDVKTHLLKESDIKEDGKYYRFMVWDNLANDGEGGLTYYDVVEGRWENEGDLTPTTGDTIEEVYPGMGSCFLPNPSEFDPVKDPALYGEFEITLKDGTKTSVRPVWDMYCERCEKFTPEYAEELTGASAKVIEEALFAYADRVDPRFGNGAIHCQLATDQTGNAIHTVRAVRWVAVCLGNEDIPGGYRGQTFGPVCVEAGDTIASAPPGAISDPDERINWPGPQDLRPASVEDTIVPNMDVSAEKYPLLAKMMMWTDAYSIWQAVLQGDPYPVKVGMCITGNFMSQSNAKIGYEAVKSLDFLMGVDLWHTPTIELADVVLPAAHWLECNTTRRSQGAAGAYGAGVKCVECPGEAKEDGEIMFDFYKAMGVPIADVIGYEPKDENDQWPDYYPNYFNCYQLGTSGYTWEEYVAEFQEHGWWSAYKTLPESFGQFRRYEMGRARNDGMPGFPTPTSKVELWATKLESILDDTENALPDYREPKKGPISTPELMEKYPLILTTGSRNPTFFHSEHRQLPWCREQWVVPRLEMNPADAAELGIEQGDWVWIENDMGKVRQVADLYYGINKGVVNANHTWWYPELPSSKRGWDLSAINVLVNPEDGCEFTGSSTLRAYPVKVYKATAENSPFGNPCPCDDDGTEIIHTTDDPRLKAWLPGGAGVQVNNGE